MNIDLTKLIIGEYEEIVIDEKLEFSKERLENSNIQELKNVLLTATITKLCNGDYEISGKITGLMVLPDDVTLEPVDYSFESEFEE